MFPAEAGERGRDRMRDYVGDMEYLAFTLPDGTRMVHVIRQGERWGGGGGWLIACQTGQHYWSL